MISKLLILRKILEGRLNRVVSSQLPVVSCLPWPNAQVLNAKCKKKQLPFAKLRAGFRLRFGRRGEQNVAQNETNSAGIRTSRLRDAER